MIRMKRKETERPIFENSRFYINTKIMKNINVDFKNVCHTIILCVKRCIQISDNIFNHFEKNKNLEANFNIYVCKNILINFLKCCLLNISLSSYLCVKLNYDYILKEICESNLVEYVYNIYDKYVCFILNQNVKSLNDHKHLLQFNIRNENKRRSNVDNKKIHNNNNNNNNNNNSNNSNICSSGVVKESSLYNNLCLDDIYDILRNKKDTHENSNNNQDDITHPK
ncbi:hypothetical protein PFLG_00831 [Plasmodium falciparum RAJ116]|uniref:Uncharacterized protein n=1 Tax=Plasmodium falciparum RAJ116 TaxID=580058 RepID=A0A0L0CUF1_PLAFA|nr:hypothetical protein PFLG_00831 [Plasmodium falciparum RAJ116]